MKGGNSSKYPDPGRYSNNHGGCSKVGSCINIYSYCKYVVSPDNKPQEANSGYGINYTELPKCL